MLRSQRLASVVCGALLAASPASAQVPRRPPCRTQCAFEVRLRGDGCCPARAPVRRRSVAPCVAPDHADAGHCCAAGEAWDVAAARCMCSVAAGCGAARCEGETSANDAPRASEGSGYDAPSWLLARRSETRRSRESIMRERQMSSSLLGSEAPRDPERYARDVARVVEDLDDLAFASEEEARATTDAQGRDALHREAGQHREALIREVQGAVSRAPTASMMDLLLFRLGWALGAQQRHDEALRVYRVLIQRFPRSVYVPHAFLVFAEHYFEQSMWSAAAEFYERVALPATTDNRVRALALYRLAWTRLFQGDAAGALARFDEVLAWAVEHPDAPDIARLAAVARVEREVALWAAQPDRRVSGAEVPGDVDAMARAASVLLSAGASRGAMVLYRRLLDEHDADARYCAWRRAATREMDALTTAPGVDPPR